MNARTGGIIAIVVVVILVLCSTCVCGAAAVLYLGSRIEIPVVREPLASTWSEGTGPAAEIAVPVPTTAPPPDEAEETLHALAEAVVPDSDLHELGVRFLGVDPDTPRIAATSSPDYPVGTTRVFEASNLDANESFELEAELLYKTEHVYMWVEKGLDVDQQDLEEAADLFEEHTYPTDREFFGTEWSPGVDGDPHLSILHASNLGRTVAGYFSSADSYVQDVREDSNEMEMFYIHVDKSTEIGDPFYNGVLAHEFQHMIHWYNDRNETTWLNEGCSELAMELNNQSYPGGTGTYDVGGSEFAYLDNPDTQLNTWPEVDQTGSASAHYGAAYLFTSYFLDRFGEEATQALVAHEANGMESVDLVLDENLGLDITHYDVFADWAVANLIDDPDIANGQFGYNRIDIYAPDFDESFSRSTNYPQEQRSTVHQYGVDYIEIESRTPLEFAFTGSTQAQILATDANSGQYLWWTNRGDESNPKLTRIVDLTGAETAELSFWSWYHIEEDWDYAYVVVGTTTDGAIPANLADPDISWEILSDASLRCTTADPNNGNLGCGITGQSSDWESLTADLSPYTGQEIALRFEYVTDAAVNQAGMAIDDIQLMVDGELVFLDDAETIDDTWICEGFVRHANVLPQSWIVQLVMADDGAGAPAGTPVVTRFLSADGTTGTWTLPFTVDAEHAVLTISAIAPVTTEPAIYEYTLSAE